MKSPDSLFVWSEATFECASPANKTHWYNRP